MFNQAIRLSPPHLQTTRVALDGTDAVLLLRPDGAHVRTACPALRHVLTDCLTQQLAVL